jgi:hypothetical protein
MNVVAVFSIIIQGMPPGMSVNRIYPGVQGKIYGGS